MGKNAVVANETAAKNSSVRVSLATKETRERSLIDEIRSDGLSGLEVSREDGTISVVLKFPGHAARLFSLDDLRGIRETLTRPVAQGDSPAAVFDRTFSQTADGGFTAQFSEGERARSLTISGAERGAITEWFAGIESRFPEFERLVAVETEKANAVKDNSPQ